MKHSERRHSLLQGHLEYVMHTFELRSQKVSISLRLPMQKKGFSLFLQCIYLIFVSCVPRQIFGAIV